LSTAIDESDSAIISNVTDISLYKKLLPDTTVSLNYTLLFNTALEVKTGGRASTYDVSAKTAVTSDIFTFGGDQCQLDDNGAGLVRIMKRVGTTLSFVEKIGIVDYATGTIQLIGFQPDSIIGDHLKIFVIPADEDVSSSQNTIMTIEPTGINLTIEQLQQ
jgi:hypothetical protein